MKERRWRRPLVVGAAVLGAAAIAIGSSGCLVLSPVNPASSQLNQVGTVQINTNICASSNAVGTTCPDLGNSGANALNATGQSLLGYRVSAAAVAPATFTSVDTTWTMTQNATCAAELQRIFPAPAGEKWVGYVSQPQTFNAGGVSATQFLPEFQLGQGANGSPFQGPFNYRVVDGI